MRVVCVFVQQVDVVVSPHVEVFVEVVSCANLDEFSQICIATFEGAFRVGHASQVFTFGLHVGDCWTQAKIELVLSNNFEVLRFVSKTSIAIRPGTGGVTGFSIGGCQVDVVGIVFQTQTPCFSFVAFAVSFLIQSTVSVAIRCDCTEAFAEIVTQRVAYAVTVRGFNVSTVVFALVLNAQAQGPSTRPKKLLLR